MFWSTEDWEGGDGGISQPQYSRSDTTLHKSHPPQFTLGTTQRLRVKTFQIERKHPSSDRCFVGRGSVFLLTFYRDSCLIFSISLSLIFHVMGLIIYLMRYGNLPHVFHNIFIPYSFPQSTQLLSGILGFKIRIQWEDSAFSTTPALCEAVRQGTTKNENELIRPPRVILPTFLSDKSQMYMRIENPELMFIALPCWVSSIWYEFIASCSHYTSYCLQSNKRSNATVRFDPRLLKQFHWFFVEISRLFRTQDKDLRQSALSYITDNKDVLRDLYKAGGPMELIFEGPENIDIFLMKDSNR